MVRKTKLEIAVDNRYKCTECKETIHKGDKYFRDAKSGWRSSHTVNICTDCLIEMFFELNLSKKDIVNRRKMFIADEIIRGGKKLK